MEKLLCCACGAPVTFQPGMRILKCEYCGTENYLDEKSSKNLSGIQELTEDGRVYFTSYVPHGWETKLGALPDEISGQMPVVCRAIFIRHDQRGYVHFKSHAVFTDLDANNRFIKQNHFDINSRARYRTFLPANEYCDDVFRYNVSTADNLSIDSMENMELAPEMKEALARYRQHLTETAGSNMSVYAEHGARKYSYVFDGKPKKSVICALIGSFGANQTGSAAGVRMNMANERMQANNRMARTINNTQNEISQMREQVYQNQQNSRDRIDRRWNEALREVNSYYSSDGIVEASNKYDHIYQNNQNPDWYAGTVNGTLDSAYYDELKRRE